MNEDEKVLGNASAWSTGYCDSAIQGRYDPAVDHVIEPELLQTVPRHVYQTTTDTPRTRWESALLTTSYVLFIGFFVGLPLLLIGKGIFEIGKATLHLAWADLPNALMYVLFGLALAASGLFRASCDYLERRCVESGIPLAATLYKKSKGTSDKDEILYYCMRTPNGRLIRSEKYVTDTQYNSVDVGDTLTVLYLPKLHPSLYNVIYRFTSYAAVASTN